MGRFPQLTPVQLGPQVLDHMAVSHGKVMQYNMTKGGCTSNHTRCTTPNWVQCGATMGCDQKQVHRGEVLLKSDVARDNP